MAVQVDPMAVLLVDIRRAVFKYLPPNELGKCAQVSRAWKVAATDDQLWKEFFARANINSENLPENLKSIFNRVVIKDKEALLASIRTFASGLKKTTQAEYTCSFLNPSSYIKIRFGRLQAAPLGSRSDFIGPPTVRELVVYRDPLAEAPQSASAAASAIPEDLDFFGTPFRDVIAGMGNIVRSSTSNRTINGIKISVTEHLPNHDDSFERDITRIFTDRLEDIERTERNRRIGTAAAIVAGIALVAFIALKINAPGEL